MHNLISIFYFKTTKNRTLLFQCGFISYMLINASNFKEVSMKIKKVLEKQFFTLNIRLILNNSKISYFII